MKRTLKKFLNLSIMIVLFTCFFTTVSFSSTVNSNTPVKVQDDNRLYKHNGSDNNNQQPDNNQGNNQSQYPENNNPQGQNNTPQGTADQAHPDGYY